ncbi:hypothetical protein [Pseudogracilibacillus sp. SO30301A]|uniref:hypothetical protein n=1 Tax=Pseudogracilibacillus sp. SO30301A TaxID=3098291 RepID=UPI00300E44BB
MKRKLTVCLFGIAFLLLGACANDDETANELIDYYNNDWQKLQTMKSEKIGDRAFDWVAFDKEENPEEGIEYLENEVLPELDALRDYLYSIEPKTEAVRELHQLQIEAEEFGFQIIEENTMEYYRDEIEDEEIWAKVDELKDKYDAFSERLHKLMGDYDLEFEKDTNEEGKTIQVIRKKIKLENV